MSKWLYFMEQTDGLFNTANDFVGYPLERFKGFRTTDTTELQMEFDPALGTVGLHDDASFTADTVGLTVTANKQKEAIQDIVAAINAHPNGDPCIVIADDSNSVFASQYITGCSITVTAEA